MTSNELGRSQQSYDAAEHVTILLDALTSRGNTSKKCYLTVQALQGRNLWSSHTGEDDLQWL